MHAPAGGVSRVVGDLRRRNHRLRWRAAGIDARPSKMALLNQRDAPSAIRERISQRVPTLSRADYDCIVVHVLTPCLSVEACRLEHSEHGMLCAPAPVHIR